MYEWEARLIEALNEVCPTWRDDYGDPEEAARILIPDYPGLEPGEDDLPWSYE